MYNSFLDDFKNVWNKPNNTLPQIIIINVIIWVSLVLLYFFGQFIDVIEVVRQFINDQFTIPARIEQFIFRPWSIVTYAFNHSLGDIWHIIMNMLMLYWFGRLIVEYLGTAKLISLYILGAMAGGVMFLIAYNTIPFLIERSYNSSMVGASGAVYAITVAAATLIPNYTFFLVFLGPVRIKYIAAFGIFLSFIGSTGSNAGGNIAHLGGAFLGYIFIKQLQSGTDIGAWVHNVIAFFKSFFTRQSNIKVSHKKSGSYGGTRSRRAGASSKIDQAEIDAILDKISQSGYESLSKEEKQKLFNASKK